MKKILIIASAAVLAATSAMATGPVRPQPRPEVVPAVAYTNPLSFGVYAEYAVEVQNIEIGLDASYDVNDFTFSAEAIFSGTTSTFAFSESSLGVSYRVTDSASVYTNVTFDNNFNYQDVVIGVAARF